MPIYEYTQKGLANKALVFDRIYKDVSEAVRKAPVAKETPPVVKAAIENQYRQLVEEGFLYVVDKRKKNGGKPCPE